MPKETYNRIKRFINRALEELEKEAIKEGIPLSSAKFNQLAANVKNLVLKREGVTFEEFEAAGYEEPAPDTLGEILGKVELMKGETGPAGPEGPVGPQGPEGKQGPACKDGKDGRDGKDGAPGKPGPKGDKGDKGDPGEMGMVDVATIAYLENEIKNVPRLDEDKLEERILTKAEVSFKKNIDLMGMPDFRKLSMGLRQDLDKVINTGTGGSFEYDNGNVATTATIDWGIGNVQYVTLTGATTFTFTGPKSGGRYLLHVAGAFTPTFPSTVRWPNNTTPTATATAGRKDIYMFTYSGKESLYDGTVALNFVTT